MMNRTGLIGVPIMKNNVVYFKLLKLNKKMVGRYGRTLSPPIFVSINDD